MNLNDFYTYTLTTQTDESIQILVNLNPKHPIYKGHFPNNPVLPGIMQIELIQDIYETLIKSKIELKKVSTIKYLNIITPDIKDLNFEISYTVVDDLLKIKCIIKKRNIIYTKFSGQFSRKN